MEKKSTSIVKAKSTTCKWEKESFIWYSGINNNVKISILNGNIIEYGNDFALDDIYFGEYDIQSPPADCSSRIPARFSFSITECMTVSFKPLAKKNKQVQQIRWDFGDGSSSTLWKPVHRYKRPGSYKVTAVITSKPDCMDTFTRIITCKPAKADFTYTEMGQPGKLAFRAERNGQSYDWDFGDGIKYPQEAIAVHQYKESGSYTTSLVTTTASGCRDTLQKTIQVLLPEKILIEQAAEPSPESTGNPSSPTLEYRRKDIIKKIEVVQDSVQVLLYDNGIIDGDSITLLLDEQVLLTHRLLTSNPLRLIIPVSRDKERHELTMYAENLGSIPPNTAYMVILDGAVKYEIYISSSKKSNGVVLFTRDPGNRPFD